MDPYSPYSHLKNATILKHDTPSLTSLSRTVETTQESALMI